MLTFVGRIQPLKAPDVMLRAVAVLLAQTPSLRSRLVVPVVGGPSGSGLEHPDSLARLADELGLDDVVRFVPPVAQTELVDWYAASTLVGVPSYNESFGLVAIEAQATGTPVVAAAVGGLTTVVRDGHSGLLVEDHEARDGGLASRVIEPGLRERLRGGRWSRRATFGWDRTAEMMLEVYAQARTFSESPSLSDPAGTVRDYLTDDRDRVHRAFCRASSRSRCRARRSCRQPCRFDVGEHALEVHAFVCRKPDENFEGVYRWLLERNMKMYAVSFALDGVGDIYLDARLPLAVGHARGDRPAARRRCWSTPTARSTPSSSSASPPRSARSGSGGVSRGEPTRNLEAFRGPLSLDELGSRRRGDGRSQPARRR